VLDVTDVLLTAIVPEESVAVPLRALLPSLMTRPFPAVPTARFPLVAVIAPAVAVKVVVVVKEPGHVMADGRENVIDAPELLPVAVIWPDVPSRVIMPADGLTEASPEEAPSTSTSDAPGDVKHQMAFPLEASPPNS
jgi:hypothetical protein